MKPLPKREFRGPCPGYTSSTGPVWRERCVSFICVACNVQNRVEPRAPLHPITVSYLLEVISLDFLSLGGPTDRYQNILAMTYFKVYYLCALYFIT